MIKVMVVDDHALIRKGIILLLETNQEIEIVGEAGDGEEAILLALKEKPDVIIMDLSMPNGVDGFAATMDIRRQLPACKIILLTMHDEEIYVQKAIQADAHGYILKKSQDGELNEAIQAVLRGERFYRTGIPQEQLQKMFDKKGGKSSILTMREQEIVRLTILGFTNAQIAEKLFISPKTVENHKTNIMQKLELKSKHELIRYGIQNHYLDLTV